MDGVAGVKNRALCGADANAQMQMEVALQRTQKLLVDGLDWIPFKKDLAKAKKQTAPHGSVQEIKKWT